MPAVVIIDFPSAGLAGVESVWMPARKEARAAGDYLEHGQWDWQDKVSFVESGERRLIAVECRDEVQGMMAVKTGPRPGAIGADPGPVLYVDYLESAPWNLKGRSIEPRFLGVGTVLIAEAVRLSLEAGWLGRVGLHSLPQAEGFYESHCRMTRIGRDPNYHDLTYFEYTGEQAVTWLTEVGFIP